MEPACRPEKGDQHENQGNAEGRVFHEKLIDAPKESQVWIRGDYDRSQRKYECQRFDDANKFCYLDGDREVYTEPTF